MPRGCSLNWMQTTAGMASVGVAGSGCTLFGRQPRVCLQAKRGAVSLGPKTRIATSATESYPVVCIALCGISRKGDRACPTNSAVEVTGCRAILRVRLGSGGSARLRGTDGGCLVERLRRNSPLALARSLSLSLSLSLSATRQYLPLWPPELRKKQPHPVHDSVVPGRLSSWRTTTKDLQPVSLCDGEGGFGGQSKIERASSSEPPCRSMVRGFVPHHHHHLASNRLFLSDTQHWDDSHEVGGSIRSLMRGGPGGKTVE